MNKKNITIVGLGYVGLSNLLLLAPYNKMIAFDINNILLNDLRKGISPIVDKEIQDYLKKYYKQIKFSSVAKEAFLDAQIIIISTSTNFDEEKNYFDTSSIEEVIYQINIYNKNSIILIKSTIPYGFTNNIKNKYPNLNIIFSPEFLREGKALYDNLYPSRIVIGDKTTTGKDISKIFIKATAKKDVQVFFTNSFEAEAIKLFSNTYLAMRVSFFNELDSFSIVNDLNAKSIIDGICSDERIGNYYNNPSFGYGGYCLPKDTKQLLANFHNTPQNLIEAIIYSNETRKNYIVDRILNMQPKIVGIYRLIMKMGSDNFRSSSIYDVVSKLIAQNIKVFIYEPLLNKSSFDIFELCDDFETFAKNSDLIIANRNDKCLEKFSHKVFTRDIYNEN